MKEGRYGSFGGQFVPEIMMKTLQELQEAFDKALASHFVDDFLSLMEEYGGRPTPLTEIKQFSKAIGGPRLFLKREDLLHTGAHKLNNAMGQCLLAKRMGKTRIIAETGAGQHGVATATACARLGLECEVYMGTLDAKRQAPNVERMRLLGAHVTTVDHGQGTLKDAINEALRDWSSTYKHTHYCIGSALGPHPFPHMVKTFQSVIGQEAKKQVVAMLGQLPDLLVACVGGGSNAIGFFAPFLESEKVQMVGVEAGGIGSKKHQHAARFLGGKVGVLHGCKTYVLQDEAGQIEETHSISAGLDYPAVGPEHAFLFEQGRVHYTTANDNDAINALKLLSKEEGIIPALESSHALAYLVKVAHTLSKESVVIINLSGRGEKDLPALFNRMQNHDN